MHPLYTAATEIVDRLKEARIQVSLLSLELSQAEYNLRLIQAKVERGLIRKVGGEKALAPTSEDRARIYTLAVDADSEFKSQLKERNESKLRLERAKAEASSLRNKLDVMLTAMRVAEDG